MWFFACVRGKRLISSLVYLSKVVREQILFTVLYKSLHYRHLKLITCKHNVLFKKSWNIKPTLCSLVAFLDLLLCNINPTQKSFIDKLCFFNIHFIKEIHRLLNTVIVVDVFSWKWIHQLFYVDRKIYWFKPGVHYKWYPYRTLANSNIVTIPPVF